ncbi:TPA: hypothetical protein ACK3Q6_002707 [Burkholderia cepacia]|uniref:hypothetical protein n=1 Tax=Burkholderia cepacia complex TaxID=87882 RepID=UPI00075265D9|nr:MULTISPECIES: hypothetical protein [Burkholderia cepacia complex]HDR9769804.1 hypothetical protein [Burkholderia cepacia ATCC 25416]KVV20892.1 hypothetical protein WK78_26650 [Burkholderia cepacia]MCA8361184.1 hypothetical protein [Burkholderia cepacia]MDN7678017.1 hypothetical protein [Burkholderia cenocepacia]MDO5941443.1 hypothetical protein [Burkholderia cepacia]
MENNKYLFSWHDEKLIKDMRVKSIDAIVKDVCSSLKIDNLGVHHLNGKIKVVIKTKNKYLVAEKCPDECYFYKSSLFGSTILKFAFKDDKQSVAQFLTDLTRYFGQTDEFRIQETYDVSLAA